MTTYFGLISQALSTLNQGSIYALAALFAVLALGEMGVPFPFVLQGVLFFIGYQIIQGATLKLVPLVLVLITGRLFGAAIVHGEAVLSVDTRPRRADPAGLCAARRHKVYDKC